MPRDVVRAGAERAQQHARTIRDERGADAFDVDNGIFQSVKVSLVGWFKRALILPPIPIVAEETPPLLWGVTLPNPRSALGTWPEAGCGER